MFEQTLYGLDKKGGFKVWHITAYYNPEEPDLGAALTISHGKLGGKMTKKDEIFEEGKQGRTPYEQAVFEAKSRIKKQMDKNYRETREELNDLPILAMLAMDYLKVGNRMTYPCYASRKLDGVRAMAKRFEDRVELKSRTNQDYSVEHIQKSLMKVMEVGDVWDGELYIENCCLEDIVSAVKKKNEKTHQLEFLVFDVVSNKPFYQRLVDVGNVGKESPIRSLEYFQADDEDEMLALHKLFVNEGYEGIMLRSMNGEYESGKRSAGLMKRKDFLDSEFKIVDVIEDKQGNGVFVLRNDLSQDTFNCVMGSMSERKEFITNKRDYLGKMMTVKYQTRYRDTKLPQFPVGVVVRDYE